MNKRGVGDFFICDDCEKFSGLVNKIYSDLDTKIRDMKTIDPEITPIFRMIADSSFITAQNPQTRIFYKMCEFFVENAVEGKYEITEDELNRGIPTTRAWSDALKVFAELELIDIKRGKYMRTIILKDKMKKFAKQFFSVKPKTQQLTDRLAHIYTGYVLLYILNSMADMDEGSDPSILPYKQRPKTLWITLMYIWTCVYDENDNFSEEDMRKFMAKRRVPSTSRSQIIRALQNIDGKTVQSLIKDWKYKGDDLIFTFDDYVILEMERLREDRERKR